MKSGVPCKETGKGVDCQLLAVLEACLGAFRHSSGKKMSFKKADK
jgi:hypothetical protein